MSVLYDKENAFLDELENDNTKKERRYFIYGYLNAFSGSIKYATSFFNSHNMTAKEKELLPHLLNGIKESTSDHIAFAAGMCDSYKLISKCNNCKFKREIIEAFFAGINDGYARIFSQEHLSEQDVRAFVLASGEQKRRESVIIDNPIPPNMNWPHILPEYYIRTKDALTKMSNTPDKYCLFYNMVAMSNIDDEITPDYQLLIDDNDINYLVSNAQSLEQLSVLEMQLKSHFSDDKPQNTALLIEKSRDLANNIFRTKDNLAYTYCIPNVFYNTPLNGEVGKVFNNIQQEFNAKGAEVDKRKTSGRLFVVFNNVTGICLVDRTAQDLKTGIPYEILKHQEQIPDSYLPSDKSEQSEKEIKLLYAKLRKNLQEIQNVINDMGLEI